jgi:hypothetical protein
LKNMTYLPFHVMSKEKKRKKEEEKEIDKEC